MMKLLFLAIFLTSHLHSVTPSRILAVHSYAGHSHETFLSSIWKELSLRGHQVTTITTRPLRDPSLVNLTEIDAGFTRDMLNHGDVIAEIIKRPWVMQRIFILKEALSVHFQMVFQMEEVVKMMRDDEFDLLIVEPMVPLSFAFGARYNVPIITAYSLSVMLEIHDIHGNPTHPVASPDVFTDKQYLGDYHQTFLDKLCSFLYHIVYRMLHYWYTLPKSDKIARKYFGDDMPYLGDIMRNNTVLSIVNSNPIVNEARPNVPSIVEVGQVHLDDTPIPKLDKDLRHYLNSSKNGVIYFSLGTIVKASSTNRTEMIQTITSALAELPFNFLWKNDDQVPSSPPNVLIRKWFPQRAVLNHPNVKAFITQGGMLSVDEAISAEVPMVGIPFIVDQWWNFRVLVKRGMAESLDHNRFTKDDFKAAVMKVATNPSYKLKMIQAKKVLLDQPLRGLDKAVWWVEYVLRHGRAEHLKSPAADMSMVEYFMVDVIAFLIGVCFLFLYIVCKLVSMLVRIRAYRKVKSE